MKLDKPIIDAIGKGVREVGGQTRFAEVIGESPVNINRWLKAKYKTIDAKSFSRLYPHIKKYLPDESIDQFEEVYINFSETGSAGQTAPYMETPVVPLKSMSEFDPIFDRLDSFAKRRRTTDKIITVSRSWKQVAVQTDYSITGLQQGTYLVVSSEHVLQDNCQVLVRETGGAINVMTFSRNTDKLILNPINSQTKQISIDMPNIDRRPHQLDFCFRILEIHYPWEQEKM